jgi:hypothetical protein
VDEYYRALFDGGELFSGISDGRFQYTLLKSSMSVGSDDKGIKYQLNIYLPALDPNMFYDIVYLRKPSVAEATEYVKLFQMYYDDKEVITPRFQTQLKFINELKKPFQHKIMSGPTAGNLDTAPLENMYGTVLRAEFVKLAAAAAADKAAIQSNIISIIRLYKDPAPNQYLMIFGKSLGASTTYFSFDTRSKFTITPDFGYVYYGFQDGFQGMTPYIGAQIEFRYYDKNMPFRLIPNKKLMHYLSFTTGLTLASLKEQNRREDFFSGKSMLIGLGIRLSNSVRFTFGGVLFNKLDPNPLVDNKTLAITPFTGISVDLKLQSLFGDLASLVPINRR